MNTTTLVRYKNIFLLCALLGFLTINLTFLYYTFIEKEIYQAAMKNGLALVFMAEALLLMSFFAFLLARLRLPNLHWLLFIGLSLAGSLAFSVPFSLYIWAKNQPSESNPTPS